ncbi:purine permease 5 [Actinidia rufa]|uniref:Purine permease 5 n=1 Tax=Actinidia rufa TaxID=165716 RepID=A0A7J0DB65_9ERIC|nr:purine permease 5 [Actinidia rufa]
MEEGMREASRKPSVSLLDKISTYRTIVWETYKIKPISYWILLLLSSAAMLVVFPASSLLSRLYFSNGGKSKWIISWAAVAGWPLTAIILISTAADNLMYAYAYAYLPASTASLLAASSLVFSALFGYLIVKNEINASTINAIMIITAAMAIIGLDSDSDRYGNVTNRQYILGFVWDIMGSALHGLIFARSELVFVKLLGRRSFHVVLEQQVMVSLFAFIFTIIGLIVNHDFQTMASEARSFKGAGVLNAVRVPITSIAAVILMNDPMSGFKILSLVITFWGFASYIYGNYPVSKDPIL